MAAFHSGQSKQAAPCVVRQQAFNSLGHSEAGPPTEHLSCPAPQALLQLHSPGRSLTQGKTPDAEQHPKPERPLRVTPSRCTLHSPSSLLSLYGHAV